MARIKARQRRGGCAVDQNGPEDHRACNVPYGGIVEMRAGEAGIEHRSDSNRPKPTQIREVMRVEPPPEGWRQRSDGWRTPQKEKKEGEKKQRPS